MHWFEELRSQRMLWFLLSGVLVCRLVFASFLPLTPEEVALLEHAQSHPGRFADLLALWLQCAGGISVHPLLLRVPQVLLPLFIAGLMPRFLSEEDEGLGHVAALAWLCLPPQFLHIQISSLTPLQYFVFASVAFFYPGVRDENHRMHIFAGLFLGLALITHVQGLLLAGAYLTFALLSPGRERRSLDVLIVFASAAVVVLLFLLASTVYGLPSWLTDIESFEIPSRMNLSHTLWFVVVLTISSGLYLFSPLMRIGDFRRAVHSLPASRSLWILALFPLAVLALLSPFGGGALGVLSFIPLLILSATVLLGRETSLRAARWMSGVSIFAVAVQLAMLVSE
ncbi:MAG TPA: glycosyltransferase family 39 protein [Burkholderiales bacterium]|nr:glycosyltransferase family 39 protein [Burkholderiales bacterium]